MDTHRVCRKYSALEGGTEKLGRNSEETKAREEQEQEERVKELCAVKRTLYSVGSAKKPDLQLEETTAREEQEQKEGVKEFVQ